MFQQKRSPEPCMHSILNTLYLEHDEKCIFILRSESLRKSCSVEGIFPCPFMKTWQVPCLFSLFLDSICSCSHFRNQNSCHSLKNKISSTRLDRKILTRYNIKYLCSLQLSSMCEGRLSFLHSFHSHLFKFPRIGIEAVEYRI